MKKQFKKDFSVISKDPEIAKKLEENFHFFGLKTDEEQQRIMKKKFNAIVRYAK